MSRVLMISHAVAGHGTSMLGLPEGAVAPGGTPMEKTNPIQPDGRTLDAGPEPLLLRPAEAARFLAISPRKLWELTNCHEVPAIRIGRALRYPTDELRAWVAGRSGRRS